MPLAQNFKNNLLKGLGMQRSQDLEAKESQGSSSPEEELSYLNAPRSQSMALQGAPNLDLLNYSLPDEVE